MDFLKKNEVEKIHFNLCSPAVSVDKIDSTEVLSFADLADITEKIFHYGKKIGILTHFLFLAPHCILPKKLYPLIKDSLIKNDCSIRTRTGITINVNGDIVPCNHLLDFSIIKKNMFQSLTDKSEYLKILESPKIIDIQKNINVFKLDQCKTCPEITLCQGGGCPLFWFNKDIETNFYRW
ncbi:SPASM domain-containing protein [Candidatus Roizmanbacteria bacterium]|nr:SPASM domain-containing protein [Candidatus Roizmanbacteria bacterium]